MQNKISEIISGTYDLNNHLIICIIYNMYSNNALLQWLGEETHCNIYVYVTVYVGIKNL